MQFKKVSIVGVGLLGGSLALAMKEKRIAEIVTGYSRREENRDWAVKNGVLDAAYDAPEEAVDGADLVVLATPVLVIPDLLRDLSAVFKPGAAVTDVGSVKQRILEAVEDIPNRPFRFVGSHPMAGGEQFSVRHSRSNLFVDCLTVVVNTPKTDMDALTQVSDLWTSVGSRVILMSPGEHDFMAAAASHLPHLTAVNLVETVRQVCDDDPKTLTLLAGGFRDTTRVASGSPEMWMDICESNREKILSMLRRFRSQIDGTVDRLERFDRDGMQSMFQSAREFRDAIPSRAKGILGAWFELHAEIDDRPGIIGEICSAIGEARINIRNLYIRHVREKSGGALAVAFETGEEREAAATILENAGFKVYFEA